MNWPELRDELLELEASIRSNLGEIARFNRDAPNVPGMKLEIGGREMRWPVDTEKERVALALVVRARCKLDAGGDVSRVELERLLAEARATIR